MTKDKSFREMVKKDKKGYLPISKLMCFNKIKEILFEAKIVSFEDGKRALLEGLNMSEILKLNRKMDMVKRAVPFDYALVNSPNFQNRVDKTMVYIENLPLNTNQDILGSIFEKFGKILHISIPKHKTKVIKGFAFIQFSVKKKCLMFFRKKKKSKKP